MGRQSLITDENYGDVYLPVFTFLEYFFYMGWLKVRFVYRPILSFFVVGEQGFTELDGLAAPVKRLPFETSSKILAKYVRQIMCQ